MKNLFYLLTAVSLIACNDDASEKKEEKKTETVTSNNSLLTEDEQKDGWQLLFDGTSTKGWHNFGGVAVGNAWSVQDNSLFFDGSLKKDTLGQDILTDEEYENFHLKLEWKVDSNGNSGIMFYVNEDTAVNKKPYWTGPEMQVLDNAGHPDAKIIKHRAGDLYDLISSSKETVKPALQWNQVEIKALNGKLDFWLNGENIVSTTMWDDNWKKMIAASKFKQWPGFGTYKKGRICLQDHGDKVWFRNIKIKKL
jgi:Domain of Unknown Function (DUF1080)